MQKIMMISFQRSYFVHCYKYWKISNTIWMHENTYTHEMVKKIVCTQKVRFL